MATGNGRLLCTAHPLLSKGIVGMVQQLAKKVSFTKDKRGFEQSADSERRLEILRPLGVIQKVDLESLKRGTLLSGQMEREKHSLQPDHGTLQAFWW
jgi:hypothetical protein